MRVDRLKTGRFLKRYKRFFVDVEVSEGVETVHCPNTGSMKSLLDGNRQAFYSLSSDPKRKLKGTLEILDTANGFVMVNTHRSNRLVEEFLLNNFSQLALGDFTEFRREYVMGNSRFDFGGVLESAQEWVLEVKSVSLKLESGNLSFPDAETTRGQKHLDELVRCHKNGLSSHLVFLLARNDGLGFDFQSPYDLVYAQKLKQAIDQGIRVHFLQTNFTWVTDDICEIGLQKVDFL